MLPSPAASTAASTDASTLPAARRPRARAVPYGALCALLCAVPVALGAACGAGSAASAPAVDFDAQRAWRLLLEQVDLGPRPPGTEANEACRALIERELRALGLETHRDTFTLKTPGLGEVTFGNVWADFPGRERAGRPAPMVILASHIDTKHFADFRFVGASDGASSTAVLLELARVLTSGGPRALGYRFLFLDGEEATQPDWIGSDNLYGSRHHAREIKLAGEARRFKACILLDLVGDKDLKLVRDANSDRDLTELFFGAAREAGLGDHVDDRRYGRTAYEIQDDHLPFIAIDIPSLDLIDFTYGGPDNPHWHTESDVPESCSAESLGIAGRITLLGLAKLEAQSVGR